MMPASLAALHRVRVHRGARFYAALLLLVGCKSSSEGPDRSPPPRPATEASAANPPSPASAANAPSAVTAASGAPASADGAMKSALAGTWKGAYDAKKGSVEMPAKVKDKPRASDDGKAMAGPGKVELEVAADGNVRGKASGALGDATLSGKLDEAAGVLRASWFPTDPSAPNAMTGVLIGLLKEGSIQAEIRVAGPDATLVREAKLELKR
jgi:hypothetical protein